jgi:hypothetical protein
MVCTPTYQRNANRSGGIILLVPLEATFGVCSATSPTRPKTLCGKNTNQSWRFRLDFPADVFKVCPLNELFVLPCAYVRASQHHRRWPLRK